MSENQCTSSVCAVHHRVDYSTGFILGGESMTISYHESFAVVTANNPDLYSDTGLASALMAALGASLGEETGEAGPKMFVTLVVPVDGPEGTLGKYEDGGWPEMEAAAVFSEVHTDLPFADENLDVFGMEIKAGEDMAANHNMILQSVKDGIIPSEQ